MYRTLAMIAALLIAPSVEAQQPFESLADRRASAFLSPTLRASRIHEVRERVVSYGFQNYYAVESTFGNFSAQGDAMLRRLVREIHAIKRLKRVTSGKAFLKATQTGIARPFKAVGNLIRNPVDTVTGIPKGIFSVLARAGERVSSGRTEYEDGFVRAVAAVSSFKREFARQLGVDVYSTNRLFQQELNRLAWASAVGNFTPSAALLSVSGPAVIAYRQAGYVGTINGLVGELPPTELNRLSRERLSRLRLKSKLIDRFMRHKSYSPRHKLVIATALGRLGRVDGAEIVLTACLSARSEVGALFFQQVVEILSSYHTTRSPIVRLFVEGGIVLGLDAKGRLAAAVPLDYGRWTQKLAMRVDRLVGKFANHPDVTGLEVWVTGNFSERARSELTGRGVKIVENASRQLGLMD